MTDFKLRGKCDSCRKTKWFIRKRVIKIPGIGAEAKSRDLVCTPCAKKLSEITH